MSAFLIAVVNHICGGQTQTQKQAFSSNFLLFPKWLQPWRTTDWFLHTKRHKQLSKTFCTAQRMLWNANMFSQNFIKIKNVSLPPKDNAKETQPKQAGTWYSEIDVERMLWSRLRMGVDLFLNQHDNVNLLVHNCCPGWSISTTIA